MKTALNLKNLELESVNEQLNDAQQMVCSAERKITDLELTVNMLEQKLELERKQVKEKNIHFLFAYVPLYNQIAVF